jgi:hypothetical protein
VAQTPSLDEEFYSQSFFADETSTFTPFIEQQPRLLNKDNPWSKI